MCCDGRKIIILALLLQLRNALALKNITLYLEPRVVEFNGSAALRCSYDLEGAPLYSVKWYRGTYEFYRYIPTQHPQTRVFPHKEIHVDLSVSNESQVVLHKVGFNLSGNFSCEVTADAPTFSSKFATQQMLVVALPESRPVIWTEKPRYKVLDTLRANCTSPPSEPAAKLQFFLNNLAVDRGEIKYNPDKELTWTELSVEFQLFPSHFNSGRLMLRCVAQVAGIYQFDSEVQLANGKEPVPARVTSNACKASENSAIVVFLLAYFSIRLTVKLLNINYAALINTKNGCADLCKIIFLQLDFKVVFTKYIKVFISGIFTYNSTIQICKTPYIAIGSSKLGIQRHCGYLKNISLKYH